MKSVNDTGAPAVNNDDSHEKVNTSKVVTFSNKLKRNEQLFRCLFEYSNDIILLCNPEGIITYISPSIKKIMGYEEEELVGKSGYAFVHPDFKEYVVQSSALLRLPASNIRYELPFLHKDGRWRWVESNVSNLLHIPDINAIVFNFRDITDRKETTERLLYAAALTENIADAVIGTDLNYTINSWNKGAEKMYGWKYEEVFGKEATQVLNTTFIRTEEYDRLHKTLQENGYWQGEVEQQRKDGSKIPVLASVAYVNDVNGKRIGTVAVNRDVTEQQKSRRLLNEAKDQLELTFNNIPAVIYLFDNKGEILFANKNAASIYGYASVAELLAEKNISEIRKKANELFEVQDENGLPISLHESATAVALRTAKAKQVIFRTIIKSTGLVTWTLSSASPLFGTNGELSMVLTTNTDITLQKTAEREIRRSEERFRTLAEALPQLIWTTDNKGIQEYTSKRWLEYTGLDPARENIWQQIVHPDDMNGVMKVWSESLEKGIQYIVELRLKTKEGVFRWNYVQGEPVKNDADQIVKWVGAFTDIHEQKLAEQKIRQSEENFQQLADLVPQIIWTSRPDGYLDYYNKRWYDFTGFQVGYGDQSWVPILHPDDMQSCIDTWYNSVKTGEPYQIEYRFLNRFDGSYRWFLGKALPIRDKEGNITKWFGTCTDIHDQKIATEKLELLVKERTEELQRSNEDLQQFAHVTSHDMKEPLRKIQIFGNRLFNKYGNQLDDEGKTFIEKMQSSADRLANMVDDVLKYSTVESSEEPFEKTDLNYIIQSIRVDLEIAVQQKNAVIKSDNLPTIDTSPVLMHQLFYNLVNNSLKFSGSDRDPEISITSKELSKEDVKKYRTLKGTSFIKITVEDNGIGFDQKYAENIFKTFTRLHSVNQYEGTGLGLALCKKIVWRHHGLIYAQSKEDKGSIFTIILPVNQQETE